MTQAISSLPSIDGNAVEVAVARAQCPQKWHPLTLAEAKKFMEVLCGFGGSFGPQDVIALTQTLAHLDRGAARAWANELAAHIWEADARRQEEWRADSKRGW